MPVALICQPNFATQGDPDRTTIDLDLILPLILQSDPLHHLQGYVDELSIAEELDG